MKAETTSQFAERYGLSRENFILDPLTDTDCFARDDIHTTEIAESLEIDLLTGQAPKRLVWGPYGGGKTHTLMRVMNELKELTPIHVVRIECPDLSRRSRFHDLYREGIMRGLGQDFVMSLFQDIVATIPARRDEILERLRIIFGDEEIAKAAVRIVDPGFDLLRLWGWLSGVAMSRRDLDDLGQTRDLTDAEAARLSDVIILVGRLVHQLKGQTLVLILDEMERLRSIGPDTIGTFVTGFTRLADPTQKSVSILIGASADLQTEMVDVFAENGPVVTRLGPGTEIEVPPMEEPDVAKFIEKTIAYVRVNASVSPLVSKAATSITETLNERFFPFTDEAIEALKSRLTQSLLPREITLSMTRALGRAYRNDFAAVTAECVR